MLTEIKLTHLHQDTENLIAIVTQLKTQYQHLTQLFERASAVLEPISELTVLVPQTSTEIRTTLSAIFGRDNSLISEAKPLQEVKQPTSPIIQVAYQLLPILKQGETITYSRPIFSP
jgi:hypothetical protein